MWPWPLILRLGNCLRWETQRVVWRPQLIRTLSTITGNQATVPRESSSRPGPTYLDLTERPRRTGHNLQRPWHWWYEVFFLQINLHLFGFNKQDFGQIFLNCNLFFSVIEELCRSKVIEELCRSKNHAYLIWHQFILAKEMKIEDSFKILKKKLCGDIWRFYKIIIINVQPN